MSIKKRSVTVCDNCERELQPDSEYIEVTVIAKGGKKRILHACDSDCLSDTIYDNMRSNRIVIDNS